MKQNFNFNFKYLQSIGSLSSLLNIISSKKNTRHRFGISKSRFNSRMISAMTFVKEGRPMMSHLLRVAYLLGGRLTPNWARICFSFIRELNRLKRSQGLPGVVLHLKACSVILQQVIAGYRIPDMTPLKVRVARSSTGLPRIIPSYQRKLIMRGDIRTIRA